MLGYVQGQTQVTGRWSLAWLYAPQWICRWVKQQCDLMFSGTHAAFMKALLTGDTTDLRQQESLYSNMRLAGVLHVVAISGMHIAVLTAFVQLLLGGRKVRVICIPVLIVFMLMSGCRASVVRAVIMQSLYLMAPLLNREDDPPTSLFAALLLILAVNPMAIGGVGLQLSFSCMAGFVTLLPVINRWAQRHLPKHTWYVRIVWFFWNGVMCSFCASVFSLPVAAWYFGTIPLLSPITRLHFLPDMWSAPWAAFCLSWGRCWPLSWAGGWICVPLYTRSLHRCPTAACM
jgi:competence protein ComEC